MTKLGLGEIEIVPLNEVWENDQDFVHWLADHLEFLDDAVVLDLEFVNIETTYPNSYILAENQSEQTIVIVSQLTQSDDNRLIQLLSYADKHNPCALVWVSGDFRDDHRKALSWLSRSVRDGVEIYGAEVRVVRIGDSDPAPDFTLVV